MDVQWIEDRTAHAPQWLAMCAYAGLIFAYVQKQISFRVLVTILGYTLLFFSKYYKDNKKNVPRAKQLQTWGYTAILIGLHFSHWRDAFAVAGYALAIADVLESNIILSLVLAFAVRTTHSLPLLLARIALILYMM